ncbi:DinB family protein [Sporosarcina sp.]|uniref:DinB family protein n=1 Tax=Sporosarcina sp. TaxID=49982 RepID=UPI002628B839|nr:DinB family protein [Sporosarcina sp.]
MDLGNEYLKIVKERFESVKDLGDKTISQLSEEDIHWKLNESSNSIVIIAKHVSGNMISRWTDFLTTDGEKTSRNRDQEFDDDISSRQEMIAIWEKGWNTLLDTINGLENQDLLKYISIRGEKHTVLEAIERQMAHYAYHVGQMVYIGKQLKDENWETLSIAKGKSEEYLQQKLNKHRS